MKPFQLKNVLIVGLTLAGLAVTTACIVPEGPGRPGWRRERREEHREREFERDHREHRDEDRH